MAFSKRKISFALFAFATLFAVSPTIQAAPNCEITQCRGGGNVAQCWARIKQEAQSKSKVCSKLVVGSGVSAYAMTLSLSNACIKSGAVIKMHRPYRADYKAFAVGSHWHNFYFGRIKPSAVRYFRARGGMQREGMTNAAMMISVPAAQTGMPVCRR